MIRLSALNIKEINRKGKWKYSDPELTGVETSSLRIENGHIFVAKPSKTKNSHGATFCNQAFKKGAVLAIVDNKKFINSKNKKIIFVPNTLKALEKISSFCKSLN